MTALAARCELWGGARQHSRFNNCGERVRPRFDILARVLQEGRL